ncbi:DUF4091 domain-containing protein [Pleurocapsa sp. PCC 7319]|uniref:DUF4091 domain-containing protein n=1 Tax=Pleurocapsa sp. PCC 7319 TaxID=118161 RepID=UPI00034B5F27|nr:DUF4091 domain-containing protein [Pleurocapsa sp. PCC 7319]
MFTYHVAKGTNVASPFRVWAAPALESISREANNQWLNNFPVNQNSNANSFQGEGIQLLAARGEYESFQIVIQAPKNKQLSNIDVVVSDLHNADQGVIERENITLYREHYVYVDRPSRKNSILGKGWYPDALIPFIDPATSQDLEGATFDAVPFELAKSENQSIWADIYVPRNTPPGKYQGSYTVTSDQGKNAGTINLTIWDFELPLKPTMHSSFPAWQERGENLAEELLKHKVMPVTRVKPHQQEELINKWGLNTIRLPFWSGADYHTCKLRPAPSIEEIQQASALYDESLLKFIKSSDEVDKCPNIEQAIKQWGKNIHQAGGIKHLVTMSPRPELYDDIDIWVVNAQRYQNSQAEIAEVMDQGNEVWFYPSYQTDSAPQWKIDMPPINFRIAQGFIAPSLGLTGVSYARIDGWADDATQLPLWSDDPWRKPSVYQLGKKQNFFSGEGMLIYPGAEVGVEGIVPSLRLKRIRDGIEDYEYISILKRLGDEDWALKTSRRVARDWYNWTKDPQVLEKVRVKLGNRIQQLMQNKQVSTF